MKIKRTFKDKSLRAGEVEFVSEDKVIEIFGQTDVGFHAEACDVHPKRGLLPQNRAPKPEGWREGGNVFFNF